MYSIQKEFSFSAAHFLRGLPPTHPCARMHGHNYTVRIEIQTQEVDEVGFVLDYRELDGFKDVVDTAFDHQCINDVVDFNPTAENIAQYLFNLVNVALSARLKAVHKRYAIVVHVSETPKTWASYTEVSA